MMKPCIRWFGCFLAALLASGVLAQAPQVKVIRTPDGGIQPQVAVDPQGTVHLIYYKGEDGRGDIFYARQKPGETTFSKPIQVNSQPGSAMSVGSIRGAQLAVGKNSRAHVVWNGGGGATPAKISGQETTPLV